MLCEAFRFGHEVDQINASNLCSFELLMRRMIQIEMAVSRNSKAPDFTGLSVVLSSVVDGSGAIQTKGFHKWVADKNERCPHHEVGAPVLRGEGRDPQEAEGGPEG